MANARTGPTPFGYKREDGRIVLHADEAPIRLRIFELFAEHERRQVVCDILNAEKHHTRNGALFTIATLTRLLKDEIVLGNEYLEQLVSEDLWQRCSAILKSQEGKSGPPARKATHLFAGYLRCGCGKKMYMQSNTAKYICEDCRTNIGKDDLEEIFSAQLQNYPLPADLKSTGQNLIDKWKSFTFEQKRKLVESITDYIEIADKKVTCFLVIL